MDSVASEAKSGRILFVEDENAISEPFSQALKRAGFEPVVARTAAQALDLAERLEPDLVLLDLRLPDGDGRDVCRQLRRDLGGADRDADRQRNRDRPDHRPRARSRRLRGQAVQLGGGDLEDPGGAAAGGLEGARLARNGRESGSSSSNFAAARRAALAGEELKLPRKEFDLLAELVRHAGEVVGREDLMARVWDVNWFGSTKTLDVHIRSLRKKLGDDPADPKYIETVRGVGFRFIAPEVVAP